MYSYYSEILKIFPRINWKTLYYENSPRVRFYFDKLDTDLESITHLTSRIIAEVFHNENKVVIGITFFNNEIDRRYKNQLYSAVKERGLSNTLNFIEKVNIQTDDDDTHWYYYFGEISAKQIHVINKTIVEADSSIDPILHLGCYYFGENQHILVHLYDDRGMDIISTSSKNLDAIFQKWHETVPMEKTNF